jgi:hybrid cluster-associated redox disulfide protein
MNNFLAISETTVADLLKTTPEAARLFIDVGTACAGCFLARFCTLKDVIKTYGLDEKTFVEELARYTKQKPS